MLFENIKKLVQYGIDTGLTPECERIYKMCIRDRRKTSS